MLLYLDGNFSHEIDHAVNCANMYMLYPKHSHKLVLNIIGRWLKSTMDRGLVMNT